jgi:hypothetical protein
MFSKPAGTLFACLFTLAALPAAAAPSADDACSLLTQAQVSAVVGAQVGAGSWVSPSFKRTCTWSLPGTVIVTVMTEGVNVFNVGKNTPTPAFKVTPATGVADDAYYVITGGTMVSLMTKKGNVAFKTSVYSQLPLEKLMSLEKALAQLVASEL